MDFVIRTLSRLIPDVYYSNLPAWAFLYPSALVVLSLFIAFLFPEFGKQRLRKWENLLGKLARGWQAYIIVGVGALLLNAGVSFIRFPEPAVHDEFSYLLAADTFAHGRLSNPTHPLWQHFETFYVNHQPTYASKYPPAQGMIMALGILVAKHPIVGVWLSVALACVAIFWALKEIFPAKWALVGGLLAMSHPLILGWGQSYWGGAVALAGGALVLGSLLRSIKTPSIQNALLLGSGILILSLSRPFEGLAFCVSLFIIGAIFVLPRIKMEIKPILKGYLPALLLVLVLNAGFILYYNWKVAGHLLLMPYTVNHSTYWRTPLFIWESFGAPPKYRHATMRDFYPVMAHESIHHKTVAGFVGNCIRRSVMVLRIVFFVPAMCVALFFLPIIIRLSRQVALLTYSAITFWFMTFVSTWGQVHYYAPAIIIAFLMAVFALRFLPFCLGSYKKEGLLFVRLLILISLLCPIAQAIILKKYYSESWAYRRSEISRTLQNSPQNHLVIVSYKSSHNSQDEWVFNNSDIDSSKVIWAHDMGTVENNRLVHYFKDRKIWLLEADSSDLTLKPYVGQ